MDFGKNQQGSGFSSSFALRLAFLLLGLAFVAGSVGAQSVPSSLGVGNGTSWNTFTPDVFVSNHLLCSGSPPSGNSCTSWVSQCNQVSSLSNGESYWEYLQLEDVIWNGDYSYTIYDYINPPAGNGFTEGPYTYSQNNVDYSYLCFWESFPGSSFASPSGLWQHTFEVIDNIEGNNVDQSQGVNVLCSSNSQCAAQNICGIYTGGECSAAPSFEPVEMSVVPSQPIANESTEFFIPVYNYGPGSLPEGDQVPYELTIDSTNATSTSFAPSSNLNPGQDFNPEITDNRIESAGTHTETILVNYGTNPATETYYNLNNESQNFTWESIEPYAYANNIAITPNPAFVGQPISFSSQILTNVSTTQVFGANALIDGNSAWNYTVFGTPANANGTWYNYLAQGNHTLEIQTDTGNVFHYGVQNFTQQFSVVPQGAITQQVSGLSQQYFTGDTINFTVQVLQTNSNTPISGATVNIFDPFTQNTTSQTTNANGMVTYSTLATSNNYKQFLIYSTANGYTTVEQSFTTYVVDYNGRVIVQTTNANGTPSQGVQVLVNGVYSAETNVNGTALVQAGEGDSNVTLECSASNICYSQEVGVYGTTFIQAVCSCPTSTVTINATWLAQNTSSPLEGEPVAFLNVFEGSTNLGVTAPNGLLILNNVPYGPTYFTLTGCVSNSTSSCGSLLSSTFQVNVTQPNQTVNVVVSQNALFDFSATSYNQTYSGGNIVLQWTKVKAQCDLEGCVGSVATLGYIVVMAAFPELIVASPTLLYFATGSTLLLDWGYTPSGIDAVVAAPDITNPNFPASEDSAPGSLQTVGRPTLEGNGFDISTTNDAGNGDSADERTSIQPTGVTDTITSNAGKFVVADEGNIVAASRLSPPSNGEINVGGNTVSLSTLTTRGSSGTNIQGRLGEVAWGFMRAALANLHPEYDISDYSDFTGEQTVQNANFVDYNGNLHTNIKFVFNGDGTIDCYDADTNNEITEVDDLIYVKGRAVMVQVKTGSLSGSTKQIYDSIGLMKILLNTEEVEPLLVTASNVDGTSYVQSYGGSSISFYDSSTTFTSYSQDLANGG